MSSEAIVTFQSEERHLRSCISVKSRRLRKVSPKMHWVEVMLDNAVLKDVAKKW